MWDDHIDQVCSKLNKSLALFQNCREFINRRAAFNFYYNFFFCHLIYGLRIFGNFYLLEVRAMVVAVEQPSAEYTAIFIV